MLSVEFVFSKLPRILIRECAEKNIAAKVLGPCFGMEGQAAVPPSGRAPPLRSHTVRQAIALSQSAE